jgi:hypothetical protein
MAIHIKTAALTEQAKIDDRMDIVQKTGSIPLLSNRVGTFGIDNTNDIGVAKFRANYFDGTKTLQIKKKFKIDGASTDVTFGGYFCLMNGEPFTGYIQFEDGSHVLWTCVVEGGYLEPQTLTLELINQVLEFRFVTYGDLDEASWCHDSSFGIGRRAMAEFVGSNNVGSFAGGEEIWADYVVANPRTMQDFEFSLYVYDEYGESTIDAMIEYTDSYDFTNDMDGFWNPETNDVNQTEDLYQSFFCCSWLSGMGDPVTIPAGVVPIIKVNTPLGDPTQLYLPVEGDGSSISCYMDEWGYVLEWICE